MPITRPNDVQCDKWEPASTGSKACRYYLKPGSVEAVEKHPDGALEPGMCVLPSEMLCVEWVRRHGTDAQKEQLLGIRAKPKTAGPSPYDDPEPLVLQPTAPPAPRPPARVATPQGEVLMAPPTPYAPAKEIDPASLEALERAGVEVELSAPHLAGGVTLVPARTGRTDRSEMTFREAAVIRLIVDAFPGAHVTAYRPGNGAARVADGVDESDLIPFEQWPASGTKCVACGEPQRRTPGGFSCSNGHGGAEPTEEDPLS